MVERWNGFFSHPFCVLVCLFQAILFVCMCVCFVNFNSTHYKGQIKTANTVLTRVHLNMFSFCVLAIGALK